MTSPPGLLRLTGIGKHFPGVQALADVDFEVAAGEVHALLGENGAGKSTLVKIITGAHAPDSGRIMLDGAPIAPASTADARRLGISAVYQEVNLLPNLSVAHNLFLGREPRRFGCIRWSLIHADARRQLARLGLDIDVTRSLASCPLAVQQLVAIARGILCSARVLVLDEPTTSLDATEVSRLFEIVGDLRQMALGIIFVTHFIDQVYAVSDRITVLRNGRRAGTWATADLSRPELIAQMLGKELQAVEQEMRSPESAGADAPILEVTELAADNGLKSVSMQVSRGEAVGLAGLLGSGRTELCEALFGLARRSGGSVRLDGEDRRLETPADAIAAGIALCPEDRRASGIIGAFSVRENTALARQASMPWWRRLPRGEQTRLTQEAVEDFGIVCRDIETAVEHLSGGNQQKVILARWLSVGPKVLILDEPTRGIDIGAHAEIIRLIRRLRDEGVAVVIASSEIDELIAFSNRIVVLRDRKSVAELSGSAISEPAIVNAIALSA